MLKANIRKVLHRVTGINSISQATNPATYVSTLYFRIVYRRLKGCVSAGKFRGLFLQRSVPGGSENRPKLLGTYETELDGVWREHLPLISTVVDIGADDGYYAIGIARAHSNIRTVAVECDSTRCELIRRNIGHNHVGARVEISCRRLAVGADLLAMLDALAGPLLVKCDIEGGEYILFDRKTLGELFRRQIPLIVETHIDQYRETSLIESMRAAGYLTRTIDQDSSKIINTEAMDFVSRFGCNRFSKRWIDEGRGKQFNRWVVGAMPTPCARASSQRWSASYWTAGLSERT